MHQGENPDGSQGRTGPLSDVTIIDCTMAFAGPFGTALLADLGLGEKLHRFPYELSGGERQRVAIARAMIHRPRIIFADEPTGLLDRHTGLQVMGLLRSYRDQGSLIAVTHNPEILTEADLVIRMRDGQVIKVEDRVARKTEEATA